MIKKFFTILAVFVLSSCVVLPLVMPSNDQDLISLKMESELKDNTGNLIAVSLRSHNFPWFMDNPWTGKEDDYKKVCRERSMFSFNIYTPQKAPKERIQGAHKEWEFVKDGVTNGRFKINKSDIILIHQNKKLIPNKIFVAQQEYDSVESSSVAYSNYSRYGRRFVTFPIPCTQLLDPNTKLIIKRIYKDDKVIKKDIEFSFLKSKRNQGYSIWLE